MKIFKNLFSTLVLASVLCTAYPLFSMDFGLDTIHNPEIEYVDEKEESIVGSLIGPGSLARALCSFYTMHTFYNERRTDLLGTTFFTTIAAAASAYGLATVRSTKSDIIEKFVGTACSVGVGVTSTELAALILQGPFNDIYIIRDIQRIESDRNIPDEHIEEYVCEQLYRRTGYVPNYNLLQLFFKKCREKEPYKEQLQKCVKEVLFKNTTREKGLWQIGVRGTSKWHITAKFKLETDNTGTHKIVKSGIYDQYWLLIGILDILSDESKQHHSNAEERILENHDHQAYHNILDPLLDLGSKGKNTKRATR